MPFSLSIPRLPINHNVDTGVEVLVARLLMEIQCSKGDRGRGGSVKGREGRVGCYNGSERRGV